MMNPLNELNAAMDDFEQEISTDENADYRRGFRAGVLFSYLHMKSQLKDLDDVVIE